MDSSELIELFYNRTYEKFVNKQILDDKYYIVPRQQLINYVHELINIPYHDFIDFFRNKGIERRVEVSDVTQFTSFSACEIEMCNALIWANNPGCQYLDIGRYFPNNIIAKSDSTYRRYGENHIKASTQLGLTFEYYDYWYLSCLGYIYPALDEEARNQLLARTITRNRLYQQLLVDILDHDVNPEVYINMLPEYIMKRSLRCVCSYLEICLTACKGDDIKAHNLIKSYETLKHPVAVQLPPGTNKNLRTYFEEFDYRSLSRDTTADLLKKYKKGDRKAYDILFKGYIRLVVNIAKSYNQQVVALEDLIQEGTLGLIRAFEHYNVNVNVSFSKYASWWIMQAIKQAIFTIPYIVQIPLNTISLHRKVRNFVDSFEQEQGYLPAVDDIDIYETNDLEWLNYIYQLPSDLKEMTCLVGDLDEYESVDQKPDTFQEKEYKHYFVKRLLRYLDKRNQLILTKYFGLDGNQEGETLNAIGDYFGLTRERVRQIVEKSIRQLRDLSGIKREEAKLGDLIRLDLSEQVGRVVNVKKDVNGSTILVLKMDSGETEEVSANESSYVILRNTIKIKLQYNTPPAVILQAKEKKQTTQKKMSQYESDVQREVNVLDNLRVGDRIIYGNKSCTICKILVRGDSSRLLVKYDNEVLDYVPNNKSLYRKALPQQSMSRNSKTVADVAKRQDKSKIDLPTLSSNNEINKSPIKTEEKRDSASFDNHIEVELHKSKEMTILTYNGHEFRWNVGDIVTLGLIFSSSIAIQGDPFFLYRRNILFVFMKSKTVKNTALDSKFYLLPTDTQIFKKNFSDKYGKRIPRILFFICESPTKVQFLDEVKIRRIDANFIRFESILSRENSSSVVTNNVQINRQEILNVGDVIKFNGHQCSIIKVVDAGYLYKYSIKYPDGSVGFITSKSKYKVIHSDVEPILKENRYNNNQTNIRSNRERNSNSNNSFANTNDNSSIYQGNAIIGKWIIGTSNNLIGKVVDVERLKGGIERLVLELKDGRTAYVNNNKGQYRFLL